jgi:tryprostatin B 6-hydroxylase
MSSSVLGYFLAGLYGSLIMYRLFFNPLNRFPGPYFARLSSFYLVFRSTKLDTNRRLYQLHQKDGKFVRIGPNDLSITEPDGVQVVSGATSKCSKSSW